METREQALVDVHCEKNGPGARYGEHLQFLLDEDAGTRIVSSLL
jgi:hypothetical protein